MELYTKYFIRFYFVGFSFFTSFQYVIGQSSGFSKTFSYLDESGVDNAISIKLHDDGYLIGGGRISNTGVRHPALAQLSNQGELVWHNNYYYENQVTPPGKGLVVTDTSIFMVCQLYNSISHWDLQLLCISQVTHDTIWRKTYSDPNPNYISQIIASPDDALILLSSTDLPNNTIQLRVTKVDKSGVMLWDKILNTFKYYKPQQLCITSDDNILVAYNGFAYGEFDERSALTKIALQNGNLIWTKSFPQTQIGDYSASAVACFPNGNIAFGWVKDTFPPGGVLYNYPPTVWMLDSTGEIQYVRSFHHRFARYLGTLKALPDGDILGIGAADANPDTANTGGWLFRMSHEGQIRWEKTIFDTSHSFCYLLDGILTPQNDVVAVGSQVDLAPDDAIAWIFKMGGDGCFNGDCDNTQLILTPTDEPDNSPYSEYRIYPNPVHNWINIEGRTGNEEEEYHIYSTDGRLIRRCIPTDVGQIDVGDLPAGSFFLQILCPKRNNRNITSLLFIKQS